MKAIQKFRHSQFGEIRCMVDDKGEPWFVGKDVADKLGYSNTRDALRKHVDDEDKTTVAICDTGSNYKSQGVIINESGLYSLILASKLPQSLRSTSENIFEHLFMGSDVIRSLFIQVSDVDFYYDFSKDFEEQSDDP